MGRLILACLFVAQLPAACWAAPSISQIEPVSLVPGQAIDVTFIGGELAAATGVWTSAPATVELTPGIEGNGQKADRVTYRITLAADAPRGSLGVRVAAPSGISNLRLLAVDDRPAISDQGANNQKSPLAITLPTVMDGHIDGEGSRYFRFIAGTGQRISFDVWARRLGSPLDPVLRITDAAGREIAYLDDTESTGPDSRGSITFAVAGDYYAELRDVRYRGGGDFAYHVRIGDFELPPLALPIASPSAAGAVETIEQEPNNTAEQATAGTLPGALNGRFESAGERDYFQFEGRQGQRWLFVGQTRAFGSAADLLMRLYKPDGGQHAEAEDAGTEEGVLDTTLPVDGVYRLSCEELNRRAGADYVYRVDVRPYVPGFSLAAEKDKYDTPQGVPFKIKLNVQRRDYNGPITLGIEGVDGVTATDNVLGEGVNEIQLTITPPSQLVPGSINTLRIWGTAKIGESEARVLASTTEALKQALNGLAYPPAALDGSIALGIAPPPKPEEKK